MQPRSQRSSFATQPATRTGPFPARRPRAELIRALALAALVFAPTELAAQREDVATEDEPRLRTFSQQAWGAKCDRKQTHMAACLRDEYFADLFPNGLLIGDADGIDEDGEHAILLETAEAVAAFLPKEGDPKVLRGDFTNPRSGTDGAGGALAGRLVAAKLNLAFADAGAVEGTTAHRLSEFVFAKGPAALEGRSAAEVVRLADAVLSGRYAEAGGLKATSVDVDGNGIPDTSPAQVFSALQTLNTSFEKGRGHGALVLPPPRVVEDAGTREPGAEAEDGERTASRDDDDDRGSRSSDRTARDADDGRAEREAGRDGDRASDDDQASDGDRASDHDRASDEDQASDDDRDDSRGVGTGRTDGPGNGPGRGLAKGHDKGHDKDKGLAKDHDKASPARIDTRAALRPPVGTRTSPARGNLRIRSDEKQGWERFELFAYELEGRGLVAMFLETAPDSGRFVRAGPLLPSDDEREDRAARSGPLTYSVFTKRNTEAGRREGETLPGGAGSVTELMGRRIEVRDRAGDVLLQGMVPAPAERDDERRDSDGDHDDDRDTDRDHDGDRDDDRDHDHDHDNDRDDDDKPGRGRGRKPRDG